MLQPVLGIWPPPFELNQCSTACMIELCMLALYIDTYDDSFLVLVAAERRAHPAQPRHVLCGAGRPYTLLPGSFPPRGLT